MSADQAGENPTQDQSAAPTAKGPDEISLVDLAVEAPKGADAASPPTASAPTSGASAAASPAASQGAGAELDLDSVFQAEDPEFAGAMSEIGADQELRGGEAAPAIEALEVPGSLQEEPLPTTLFGRLRFRAKSKAAASKAWLAWAAANGARAALAAAKAGALAAAAAFSKGLRSFLAMSGREKVLLLSLLALVAMAAGLAGAVLKGKRLPGRTSPFLASMADVADEAFEFDSEEEMEEFASPLRATEHVVLLERTVANLRGGDENGKTPMGLFEFYVEGSSQAAAIELGDRKAEAADVAQRAVESLSFEELATVGGKLKLKLLLRRDLTAMLTKGRVRRVYFKSILLKP